ncbi:MAG: T9SS type A sorting domain-containing protein, partial [Bacteroidales bacterium]|nr:T9SS type A sorting domain-containing protein [Bacteroidales bacterium]
GIANVALYDLQGRAVETRHGTSLQGGTATINVRNVPAGVYVLRVTDTDGKEYHKKIVRK